MLVTRLPALLRGAALVAAAAACGAPAFAAGFSVSTEPATVATWPQPVYLIVHGTSTTSCGAAAVNVRESSTIAGPGYQYFQLQEDCLAGGPPREEPFTVTFALGRLPPRTYQLVVRDEDGASAGAALTVGLASAAIIEAVEPPTSDRPLALRLRDFGCPNGGTIGVTGNVVSVQYSSACPKGIPPAVFEIERAVPPLPAGTYELRAIDSGESYSGSAFVRTNVTVAPPGSCTPADTTLCLHDRRFAVTATWRDFTGRTGVAHALLPPGNDGSGLFWFFGAENAELTVKVLDGCGVNQHWWVFVASGSSVEYVVTVTDTRTGAQRTYGNPLGVRPPLKTDLDAFETCTG